MADTYIYSIDINKYIYIIEKLLKICSNTENYYLNCLILNDVFNVIHRYNVLFVNSLFQKKRKKCNTDLCDAFKCNKVIIC